MYNVYGMSTSGNCYKVRLVLEQLGVDYQWREVDVTKGETQTPEFLAMNPAGQVPVIELAKNQYLSESNAILYYLAEESALWPAHRLARGHALRWMFFEQYSHEPYVAVARFICKYLAPDHERRMELPGLHERGYKALELMESHLQGEDYFAGDMYSIADIALYAYTHMAADGGFELQRYAAINAWIARVRQQPGYVDVD